MPSPGTKPKPDAEKRFRGQSTHEWAEVENVPFEGGPALPEFRADGRRWPERTAQKWDTWRSMPHCKLWAPGDWDFALDSIEVAALFHEKGNTAYATELRNREKILGTTADFRRDLRIKYVEPKQGGLAVVVNADDFRGL